jgi:hypothetical protein
MTLISWRTRGISLRKSAETRSPAPDVIFLPMGCDFILKRRSLNIDIELFSVRPQGQHWTFRMRDFLRIAMSLHAERGLHLGTFPRVFCLNVIISTFSFVSNANDRKKACRALMLHPAREELLSTLPNRRLDHFRHLFPRGFNHEWSRRADDGELLEFILEALRVNVFLDREQTYSASYISTSSLASGFRNRKTQRTRTARKSISRAVFYHLVVPAWHSRFGCYNIVYELA